jgi:hypothetical protein
MMADTTIPAVRTDTDPAALLASLRAQATTAHYGLPDDAAYFAQSCLADVASPVRVRQLIERAVIRRAVADILAVEAEGAPAYAVNVYDGEQTVLVVSRDLDAIMGAIMSTDEDTLIVRRSLHQDRASTFVGTITLIYGNDGWDVISNYSLSLDEVLAAANALADALGDLL